MTANPWDKFFWADYENDPPLKLCSFAAQGLWMRILCICAKSEPKGYLIVAGKPLTVEDMVSLFGKPVEIIEPLLNELRNMGVFSTDRKGKIYNRKMVRNAKKAKTARENGKNGGNPTLRKQTEIPASDKGHPTDDDTHIYDDEVVDDLTNLPGSNQKPEARSQKESITADFEVWYQAYPLHKARKAAEKAYEKARKSATAEDLLAAARRYDADPHRKAEFTKHPATWLNGECWLDGKAPQPAAGSGKSLVPAEAFDGAEIERLVQSRMRLLRAAGYTPAEAATIVKTNPTDAEIAAKVAEKTGAAEPENVSREAKPPALKIVSSDSTSCAPDCGHHPNDPACTWYVVPRPGRAAE